MTTSTDTTDHAELQGPFAQLATAFDELGEQGIVARMDFACCQNCGGTEIDMERRLKPDATPDDPYPWTENGYVFFHQQDTDRIRRGQDGLFLAFGGFPGSDILPIPETAEDKANWEESYMRADGLVAGAVAEALRRNDLEVDWDGNPTRRIVVRADWTSVPFPFPEGEGNEEEEEEPEDYDPEQALDSWYVLLDSEGFGVGDLLRDLMPRWSEQWRDRGSLSAEVPFTDEDIELELSITTRIEDPRLDEAVARLEDPEMTGILENHQEALRITARGSAKAVDLFDKMAVFGMAVLELDEPGVGGVWIPVQERFETRSEALTGEDDPEATSLLHVATLALATGQQYVVVTRGLAYFGLRDLILEWDEPVVPTEVVQMLAMLGDAVRETGRDPREGKAVKTAMKGRLRAVYSTGTDPISGAPATVVSLDMRKKLLGLF
jgi:hypothetical protein